MRGREFLEKLEQVSPVYVEEADRTPAVRTPQWPKWVATAACLCLIVWGTWTLFGGFGREPGHIAGPGASEAPSEQLGEMASEQPGETLSPEDGEAMAALREVLAGNATLIHVEQSGGAFPISVHEIKDVYIADLPENAQIPMDFAVLDLDGDGVREAVVKLDGGVTAFEILHVQDGTVCGSLRYIRSFNDLKADGTFWFSSSAADHGFGRLSFDARGYAAADRITYSQSQGPGFAENMTYVVNHRPATEAEYFAAEAEFLDKEPAEWHALTQENLAAVFGGGEPSDVASIAPEPCPDTLGFTNCVVSREEQPEVTVWWYHTLVDGQYHPIAYTFGMGDEPDVYRVDLDGDGIDELVCNNEWPTGLRDVTVYRGHGGEIKRGELDHGYWRDLWTGEGLTDLGTSADGSEASYYDPNADPAPCFVLNELWWDQNGEEVRKTATFQGLDHFVFQPFEARDAEVVGKPPTLPPDAPGDGAAGNGREPCPDTLGFTNCVVMLREGPPGFKTWYYCYTTAGGVLQCVGEACSYEDEPDVYRADLDGDGIEELICNNTYGDTAEAVRVYRNRDGIIEEGYLDGSYWAELGFETMGAATARAVRYDPEQGFTATGFDLTGAPKTEVFQGLEHFVFQQYVQAIASLGTATLQTND